MARRRFLQLASGGLAAALLPACGAPAASPSSATTRPRGPVRAICFDLFTIFDPRSVVRVAEGVAPGQGAELCAAWRVRQFEYSWLRALAGRYLDFGRVTEEALSFAARERKLELSEAQRRTLIDAYCELDPWPDTREALLGWKRAGLALAPLTNYSPPMLERLVSRAGLDGVFDALVSTHRAETYKPDPRAYALGPSVLGLPREQIAFAAFGGWDAAGAKWFGFPTFWVNRLGVAAEALTPAPDATGPTLAELARFVAA